MQNDEVGIGLDHPIYRGGSSPHSVEGDLPAFGGHPTKEGVPVSSNSKEVTVTADRLPRYEKNTQIDRGASGLPDHPGGRNTAGKTLGHISAAANKAAGPYSGNDITRQSKGTSTEAYAQKQYGSPDQATETTRDLVGGQSLTQTGEAGSSYSPYERAQQSGFQSDANAATPQPTSGNMAPDQRPRR